MISRSFNKFFKLAFQMSKNKKTPKEPKDQVSQIPKKQNQLPPEVIQQANRIHQQTVQQNRDFQKKLAAEKKQYSVKWKKIEQYQPIKQQPKKKKWQTSSSKAQKTQKSQKSLKFQKKQNSQKVQKKQYSQKDQKKQKAQNFKFQKQIGKTMFKSTTKKYFIDTLQGKEKVQKDIQTSLIKEIQSTITMAINNFKHYNLGEVKKNIEKIKNHKSFQQGVAILFQEFAQQDISKTIDLLKRFDSKQFQLPPQFFQNLLLNCAENNQFKNIQQMLNIFNKNTKKTELTSIQFLQILFINQVNEEIDYLTGQNSIQINKNNQILVRKIKIAIRFLQQLRRQSKKQNSYLQNEVMPAWFLKVSEIVQKYRFGKKQFQVLFTQILTNHTDLIPSWFYESQLFVKLLSQNYFGKQEKLNKLFDIVFIHSPKFRFKQFYINFTHQLMLYRSETGEPAFEDTQQLKAHYNTSLNKKNKNQILLSLLIAQDSKYSKLMAAHMKNQSEEFKSEGTASEYIANIEQIILNNYNRVTQAKQYKKILQRLQRNGANKLIKLKASIKLGNLTAAYKIFNETYLKPVAIQRQRRNICFVLRTKLGDKLKSFMANKDINTFVAQLSSQYLWSLHKKSEDISSMLNDYMPEDKFSFWEQVQKKQRFDQIVKLKYQGKINDIRQPISDIQKDGFNLKQYIQTELQQLQEKDTLAYQKQKQLIRFKIKVDSLNDLIRVKPDKFVYKKLKEYQQQLSEQNLAIIESFGIKDFDIVEHGWTQFNQRFQKMKMFDNIPKDQNALVNLQIEQKDMKKSRNSNRYTIQKIQQLLIKCSDDFKEASRIVQLNPQPLVQSIILWGVYTKQPMAVYMGQKLAMLTGQKISHQIAKKVSSLLSYRRVLSQEFISKCKQSLQVVGKINRQNIYDINKDYHHILYRQDFADQAFKICEQKVAKQKIQELFMVNPLTKSWQQEPKFFIDSITKRKSDYV